MVRLDRFDFDGSHLIFMLTKTSFSAFIAVDMTYVAFTWQLMLLQKVLKPHVADKGRKGMIKVVSQFLYVSIMTSLLGLLSCTYIHLHFSRVLNCASVSHKVMSTLIVLLVSLFTFSQLPFICAGGDASIVMKEDILQPWQWTHRAMEKQRIQDPGLFKASEKVCGVSATMIAALTEMLLKLCIALLGTSIMEFKSQGIPPMFWHYSGQDRLEVV